MIIKSLETNTTLTELDLSSFNMSNLEYVSDFFLNCSNLVRIKTPACLDDSLEVPLPQTMYEYKNGSYGDAYTDLMKAPTNTLPMIARPVSCGKAIPRTAPSTKPMKILRIRLVLHHFSTIFFIVCSCCLYSLCRF